MQPILHYAPQQGWMNDPNGLVHWRGRHHLFFQHNPLGTAFTNQHWGHASSTDLLRWDEHPVALAPGAAEGTYDSTAVFSGCAVVDGDRVAILYTGVEGDTQLPCLAYAADESLNSFVKQPENPVIDQIPGPDVTVFRDHSVWRDGDLWRQAVAGARTGPGGTVFAYHSKDLRSWTYDGVLTDESASGVPGPVWECPDVFRLDGVDVLIVSVVLADGDLSSDVWWMTGSLDGSRFRPSACGPLDLGNRLYAPQSYTDADGRRILIGWLRTHLDPASEGRDPQGAMSLPRRLGVTAGRLTVEPVAEIAAARTRRAEFELVHDGRTSVWVEHAIAGELVLDEAAASAVTQAILRDDKGRAMAIDLSGFAGSAGDLRLIWDAGIVEVFRRGLAASWTDLALEQVHTVELVHAPGSRGAVTLWQLDPFIEPPARTESRT